MAVLKQAAQPSMPHEVEAEAQSAEPEVPTSQYMDVKVKLSNSKSVG
jgi:hypothetical protein